MALDGETEIQHIRTYIKNRLLKKPTYFGDPTVQNEIFELIKKTLKDGESNSGLLIGPRGCGKTSLIKEVLKFITNDDTITEDYILVELHGLVHTNDHLAVNSIARQMALETVVEGKVFGSFADNLTFLISCIKAGKKHKSKRLIFILEEFDLFCSHHNQTLLYNLFDLSQSAEAPICIIGITCRLDVIELLEKRVKSRFSHRQYFLHPLLSINKYPPIEYAVQVITRHLKLPEEWANVSQATKETWNNNLSEFLGDKRVRQILRRIMEINNTEAMLKNILINIVFNLKEGLKLKVEHFQEQLNLIEKDDIVQVLQDLTVLEFCLLIAMKHHTDIYDNEPMNFEMILRRYIKFVNANSNIQTIQRPVIMKAFEHIQKLELISPISSGGHRLKEYQFFKLLVTPQQINEGIKKYIGLPTEVVHWAGSSLV